MKKLGCLSGLLITIVSIVATIVLGVFVTPWLTSLVFDSRFGSEIACAVLKLSVSSLIVYFIIAEVVFFTWQAGRIRKDEGKKGDERSDAKFKRITRIIYAASVAAILLLNVIHVNTYTEYREDSISEKFFVTTKTYDWDDVHYYYLKCESDGTIEFKISMKDGKSFELLQTVTSCSDEFLDKYENMYAYAAYLANEFDAHGSLIEKRVSGTEFMIELYKEDYPDVWKYLVEIADEKLAEDNGGGSTESGTAGENEGVSENNGENVTE